MLQLFFDSYHHQPMSSKSVIISLLGWECPYANGFHYSNKFIFHCKSDSNLISSLQMLYFKSLYVLNNMVKSCTLCIRIV
jgi:hypothetical protein